MNAQPHPVPLSRGRRIGFYTAVLASLLLVVSALFDAFPFVVVGWFDAASLQALHPDVAAIDSHRIHLLGLGALAWLLAVPVAAQLVRPATKIGAAVFGLALLVILIPTDLATGSFDPLEIVALCLFATIVWLHPARATMSFTPMRRGPLALALVGAVGWGLVAVTELVAQMTGSTSDHHVAFGHHGIMAQVALFIGLGAVVGATSVAGRRFVAVLSGAAAAFIGLASLVFPGYVSSLGVLPGVLVVAWAALYVWSALVERERPAARPSSTAAQAGV
jgi:hypothetical protein